MSTFLEAIAYQRDHAEAEWQNAGRLGRRILVLSVLADQLAAARRNEDENVNPRKPHVSPFLRAQVIADRLGLPGSRRLGSGARGGHSWSGYMASALRVTPTLASLEQAKLVWGMYEPEVRTRRLYRISISGSDWLAERTP